MLYYIMRDGQESGPYDLAGLIRKVKNGSMTAESLVRTESSQTHLPAHHFSELKDFFNRTEDEPEAQKKLHGQNYKLGAVLGGGWKFATNNTQALKASGVTLILAAMLSAVLIRFPFYTGYLLAFVTCYIVLAGLSSYMLRLSRGQVAEYDEVKARLKQHWKTLAVAGLILSVPTIGGMVLLLAPGIFVLTLYAFAPLLIMEKGYSAAEALKQSQRIVLRMGADNLGVVFALMSILVMSGIMAIIPLLVTLPVVLHGLSEIYDDRF